MKVFGIGLARTGTTSLHHAFAALGLRSAPSSVALMDLLDDPTRPSALLETHDAFTDNPVPFLVDVLHARHPDARFVYSTRPRDDWLRSMEWLFGEGLDRLDAATRRLGDEVHERLYGITTFDASTLERIHIDHHRSVSDHFADAPHQLLTLPLDTFAWEPLCAFLELETPTQPFPRANAATSRRLRRRRKR